MSESLNLKITATDSTSAAFASLNRNMANVSGGFQKLSASVSGFTRGAVGAVLAGSISEAVGQVVRYADSWTMMQNKLRSAGLSMDQTATAQQRISDIAKASRSDLTETGNLYARIAFATERMGVSQEEVARITDTLSKAFKMSGKTALESQSAVTQFSQALASGVLQGDELRSIRENAPEVARAIADAMGVSVGELKKLGEQGLITADVMVQAINSAAPKIEERFKQTRITYSDQLQLMSNAVQEFIGKSDDAMRKHIEEMQKVGMTGNVMIDNYTAADQVIKSVTDEIDKLTSEINRGNEELAKLQQQIDAAPGGSELFTQLTFEANMFKEAINETNARLDILQKKAKDFNMGQAPELPAPREISYNPTTSSMSPYSTSERDQLYKTKEQLKELTIEKNKYIESQRASLLKTREQTLAEQIYNDAVKAGKLATGFTMADAEGLAKQKIAHDDAANSAKSHSNEIENLIQKYREAADPLLQYREDLAKIELEYKKGKLSAEQYSETVANIKAAMQKAAENADPLKKQTEELTRAFEGFGRKSADAIAEFVVEGKGSFGDLIKSMMKEMISLMLYQNIFKNLFGSFANGGNFLSTLFTGARASGGSVSSNSPYLVGERGPEIFMPNRTGSIIPNSGLGGVGGGSNVSINIINNSNSQATTRETSDGRGNRSIDVIIGDVVAKQVGQIGSSVNQSIRNTFNSAPALVGR